MPIRRQSIKRPSITFINSGGRFPDRLDSRAARQHAAYWSAAPRRCQPPQGSGGSPEQFNQLDVEGPGNFTGGHLQSPSFMTEDAQFASIVQHSWRPQSKSPSPATDTFYLRGDFDAFDVLPSPVCGPNTSRDLGTLKAGMLRFFGERFVRGVLLRDPEHCQIMFTSCLLLSSTHQIAMTGRGSQVGLMELKGELIRAVNAAISTLERPIKLEVLIAVLILGMPLVSLVTNQVPGCIPLRDYIDRADQMAKSDDATPCTTEEVTRREYETHYAAVTSLLHLEADLEKFLTTYEGRYVLVNKMLSSAHRLISVPDTPTNAWLYVYGKLQIYAGKCAVDPAWFSPIYCPFGIYTGPRSSCNTVEKHLVILVKGVQNWLITFINPKRGDILGQRYQRLQELQALLANESPIYQPSSHQTLPIYNACRLTAKVMLEVEARHISLCYAAEMIPEALMLPELLRQTDFTNLWGDFKGLLYWVATICHITAPRKHCRLTSTTILAHVTHSVSISNCAIEAVVGPIQTLLKFERSNTDFLHSSFATDDQFY